MVTEPQNNASTVAEDPTCSTVALFSNVPMGFTHEMPTLHTFFWAQSLSLLALGHHVDGAYCPCVLLAYLSPDSRPTTSWTSCQWWTTWASWTDWAPQIGSIRNWPLRHCAKNHLQRIFRAKVQDKEATHLPRYFQVFWCTFGHTKKNSRVGSNVVRLSMDNLQEPLVWSCRRGKPWTCFLHPIGRWSVRKGGHGRPFQSPTSCC